MADSNWQEFVPGSSSGSSPDPTAAGSQARPADSPAQPADPAAGGADQAASWEAWGQDSLATAAVMEGVAAEHLQAASEWAAYGNAEAAQQELADAYVAAELGAESAAIASTEFELAAEYREHPGDQGAATPGDANPPDPNAGSADAGPDSSL